MLFRSAVTLGGTFGEKAGLTREMAKGQQDTSLLLADKANAPAMGQLALSGRAYDDTRNDRTNSPDYIIGQRVAGALKGGGAGGMPGAAGGMDDKLISGYIRKTFGQDPDEARKNQREDMLFNQLLTSAGGGRSEAIAQLEKMQPGMGAGFAANPLGNLQKENDTYAAVMESPRIKNEMDAIVEIAKGGAGSFNVPTEAIKARIEALAQSLVAMGIPAEGVRQAIADQVSASVPQSTWMNSPIGKLFGINSGDQIRTAAGVR